MKAPALQIFSLRNEEDNQRDSEKGHARPDQVGQEVGVPARRFCDTRIVLRHHVIVSASGLVHYEVS